MAVAGSIVGGQSPAKNSPREIEGLFCGSGGAGKMGCTHS